MPFAASYFKASFVEVGAALALFNVVSLIVQTPIGFIVDRVGPWRPLIAALVLGGLSFASLSLNQDYRWLLVAMAAAGVANGVYHPSDYALLSSSVSEQRIGHAYSIHTFSGFLGNAAAPLILVATAQLVGVAYAFVVTGGIALVVAIWFCFYLPIKPTSRMPVSNKADKTPGIFSVPVLTFAGLFIFLNLSASGIQTFSVSALVSLGSADLSSANLTLSLYLFASAIGILAGGFVADHTTHHGGISALAMTVAAAVTILIYYTAPSGLMLLATFSTIGFCSGVITPSRDILVRSVSPKGAEGRIFGVVSTGFNIGGAISPLLFGWLIDSGDYREIFGLTAIFMIVTVLLTLTPVRAASLRD